MGQLWLTCSPQGNQSRQYRALSTLQSQGQGWSRRCHQGKGYKFHFPLCCTDQPDTRMRWETCSQGHTRTPRCRALNKLPSQGQGWSRTCLLGSSCTRLSQLR
jgi:hypothetical protein